ncbi:MAG TPA: hypothetical protein VGQ57_00625, partial [Polyangiaceae bacterium]|nr:hypothetical protein [Polyangiaceae bacterium]
MAARLGTVALLLQPLDEEPHRLQMQIPQANFRRALREQGARPLEELGVLRRGRELHFVEQRRVVEPSWRRWRGGCSSGAFVVDLRDLRRAGPFDPVARSLAAGQLPNGRAQRFDDLRPARVARRFRPRRPERLHAIGDGWKRRQPAHQSCELLFGAKLRALQHLDVI